MRRCLPEELRADLTDPGIARRSHLAEQAVVDITGRIVELGMIENIKELSPDLKASRLGDARSLGQAEVGIIQSRSVEKLTTGSAELPKAARCKGTGQEKASFAIRTGTIWIRVAWINLDNSADQIRGVGVRAAG